MENLQEEEMKHHQQQHPNEEIKEDLQLNRAEFEEIDKEEDLPYRLEGTKEENKEKDESFELGAPIHKHLEESLHRAIHERDSLRKELKTQKSESRVMYLEILELEKRSEESEQELKEVRRERDKLLGEKKEMERRIDMIMEESASIVSSFVVVQTEVEERMERAERDARLCSEGALLMLRNARRMLGMLGDVKGEDENFGAFANDGERMALRFAGGLEAIERDFKSRVEKMKEMEGKIESLEMWVEERKKKIVKAEDRSGCKRKIESFVKTED